MAARLLVPGKVCSHRRMPPGMHIVMDHRRIRIRSVVCRNSRPDASRLTPSIIMSLLSLLNCFIRDCTEWLRSRLNMSHTDVVSTDSHLSSHLDASSATQNRLPTRTEIGNVCERASATTTWVNLKTK